MVKQLKRPNRTSQQKVHVAVSDDLHKRVKQKVDTLKIRYPGFCIADVVRALLTDWVEHDKMFFREE